MAEDDTGLDLDLEALDENIEKKNKVEERIKDLSSKVKMTSEERDELAKSVEELTEANKSITQERDFLASFTDATAEFPGAVEHKDAILEKVKSGYSVEDAALVIMNANKPEEPDETTEKDVKPDSPAGGSAVSPPATGGAKPLDEMDSAEKLTELKKVFGEK